jgi:hypothetical protein
MDRCPPPTSDSFIPGTEPAWWQAQADKWGDKRRDQMGVTLGLVFAIASGALGFVISFLTDKEHHFTACETWLFFVAAISFLLTVGIGLWATVNRLRDFRLSYFRDTLRIKNCGDSRVLEQLRVGSEQNGEAEIAALESKIRNHKIEVPGFGKMDEFALKTKAEELGEVTWALLRWHLCSLLFGAVCLLVGVFLTLEAKLF